MGRMTKKRFCSFAKKRSRNRIKLLRTFRKKSAAAMVSRRSHLNAYCKNKSKNDRSFCKKSKAMSLKRFKYDKKIMNALLKRATKRHKILFKHCK